MPTFSKRYYHPVDPNMHLTLVWEPGYNNLHIYYFKKLIRVIESSKSLFEGVSFGHDDLGVISIQLSEDKPIILELWVDQKKFYWKNKKVGTDYDFKGLRIVFGFFAVLRGLSLYLAFSEFNHSIYFNYIFLSNLIFFAVYLLAAIAVQKQAKLYFVALTFFSLTMLVRILSLLGISLFEAQFEIKPFFFNISIFLAQLFVYIYVLYEFKKIREHIKRNDKSKNEGILDD